MSLHPSVARAFEEIDAAIFSGDEFFDAEHLKHLTEHLERWQKQIPWLTKMSQPEEES